MAGFNFTRNNSALATNLGATPPTAAETGFQAHHLIPVEALSASTKGKIDGAYKDAKLSRDVNDRWNGIWLPDTYDGSLDTGRALHVQAYGGLHNLHGAYNDVVASAVTHLVSVYEQKLNQQISKINNANLSASKKSKLRDDAKESYAKTLSQIIEKKVARNVEKYLTTDPDLILNYRDPALMDDFIEFYRSETGSNSWGETEYLDYFATGPGRAHIDTYYFANYQRITNSDLTGKIKFNSLHFTEDEDERNGGDGGHKSGAGKAVGRTVLADNTVKSMKKVGGGFEKGLVKGGKAVFLATTALALTTTVAAAAESVPDDFTTDDIYTLVNEAIKEQIPEIAGFFTIDALIGLVGDVLTNPTFILGMIAKFLVPGLGWAATLYEIVDNFEFIKDTVEFAWSIFSDTDGAIADAITLVNDLLQEVVEWAEWFGVEFDVEEKSENDGSGSTVVDQDFDEVQEDLDPVQDTIEEARELRGQSAADIMPAEFEFDGMMRIHPDAPIEEENYNTELFARDYFTEQKGLRDEIESNLDVDASGFGDLGGSMALFGYDTNDDLWGGLYNDALYGGDGDDKLIGSPGDDYMIGGKEGDSGSEEGGDTGERYGDTVTYGLIGEFGILDKESEQQTFEFDKIHLRLGDSQYHVQALKYFEDGSTGVDRMAGIEAIILTSKSDIVEIVDGSKDFISVLWKLSGGTNGEEGDTGEIKITGSESIRSISLFNGTGYMSDALLKEVPEVSEFRSFEPGDIETAAKKFAQPVEGGAAVPTTWSKKAERPEDALGYVELEEFDADITGGEAGEMLWSTDDIKRVVKGNEGNDTISVGDTRSKEIVEKKGKSQALGGRR